MNKTKVGQLLTLEPKKDLSQADIAEFQKAFTEISAAVTAAMSVLIDSVVLATKPIIDFYNSLLDEIKQKLGEEQVKFSKEVRKPKKAKHE